MKNITYTDTKNRKWEYNIPFEITCTVSGQVKTYTAEEYINGKIERFDGLDNLRANYVSRDAKKAVKVAKPTTEGKLEIRVNDKVIVIEKELEVPSVPMLFRPEAPKPITLEGATEDVCHNPAHVLNNKLCSECAFAKVCKFKDSTNGKLILQKSHKRNKS